MSEHYSPTVVRIVRYGLPCIILIYYVTASLSFAYTPESTYLFLQATRDIPLQHVPASFANPLWQLLVAAGTLLGLDAWLTVKVFSLLFCSLAVLGTYFLAVEVMFDRVGALFVALSVAVEPWLLQLGPSGSEMGLGLVLSLSTLFFMLRGEYALAGLLSGFCTLVFWQGIGLLPVVLTDQSLQVDPTGQRARRMATTVLSFGMVVTPWIIYSVAHSVALLPTLIPFGEFPGASMWEVATDAVLGGMIVAGAVAWTRVIGHAGEVVRGSAGAVLWILWLVLVAALTGLEIRPLVFPVIVAYAFYGLKVLLTAIRREALFYTMGLLLSVVLLVEHQTDFNRITRPLMKESIQASQILMTAGLWLRGVAGSNAVIAAEAPGIIGFYSGKRTEPLWAKDNPRADYVVASAKNVEGYDLAYTPDRGDVSDVAEIRFSVAVWRRK